MSLVDSLILSDRTLFAAAGIALLLIDFFKLKSSTAAGVTDHSNHLAIQRFISWHYCIDKSDQC